jgi:hypothetical protein
MRPRILELYFPAMIDPSYPTGILRSLHAGRKDKVGFFSHLLPGQENSILRYSTLDEQVTGLEYGASVGTSGTITISSYRGRD